MAQLTFFAQDTGQPTDWLCWGQLIMAGPVSCSEDGRRDRKGPESLMTNQEERVVEVLALPPFFMWTINFSQFYFRCNFHSFLIRLSH